MRKLHSISVLAIIFIIFGFGAVYYSKTINKSTHQPVTQDYEKELDKRFRNVINKNNEDLPKMIDDITRLDSVYYLDREVTYIYTVFDIEANKLSSKDFEERLRPILINQVCTSMEAMWKYGVPVGHIYRDKKGKRIFATVIQPEECE